MAGDSRGADTWTGTVVLSGYRSVAPLTRCRRLTMRDMAAPSMQMTMVSFYFVISFFFQPDTTILSYVFPRNSFCHCFFFFAVCLFCGVGLVYLFPSQIVSVSFGMTKNILN